MLGRVSDARRLAPLVSEVAQPKELVVTVADIPAPSGRHDLQEIPASVRQVRRPEEVTDAVPPRNGVAQPVASIRLERVAALTVRDGDPVVQRIVAERGGLTLGGHREEPV